MDTESLALSESQVNGEQGLKSSENKQNSIFVSLKFITLVRCAYAVLVLLFSFVWIFSSHVSNIDINTKLLLGSVIEIFLFTGFCCFALYRNRFIRAVTYVGMVHDTLLASFLIMLTGNEASPFQYLYLIIPLYGGITLKKSGGLIGATIVCCILAMEAAVIQIILDRVPVLIRDVLSLSYLDYFDVSRAILLCFAAYGVGLLTGQLANQYAKAQTNLIENEREFAHFRGIYSFLLKELPIGVVIINPLTKQLLYSNPEALKQLNVEKEDVIQSLKETEDAVDQDTVNSWICHRGQRYLRIVRFQFEISGSAVTGYHINDITELQKAQIERVRCQRLEVLGEFSAKIAHEIRNPLACISGCNEMLQLESVDDEQKQITEMMGHEIDRLNGLINDILVFSRRPKLTPKQLNLLKVFSVQKDIFMQDAANKDIEITLNIAEHCALNTDENSLCQIIMTLWRNSSEATSGQGKLVVTSSYDGSELLFQDDGPGISDEVLAHAFEPFYTTKKSGTGLGLAIARQLAMDNGLELTWDKARKGFLIRCLSKETSL